MKNNVWQHHQEPFAIGSLRYDITARTLPYEISYGEGRRRVSRSFRTRFYFFPHSQQTFSDSRKMSSPAYRYSGLPSFFKIRYFVFQTSHRSHFRYYGGRNYVDDAAPESSAPFSVSGSLLLGGGGTERGANQTSTVNWFEFSRKRESKMTAATTHTLPTSLPQSHCQIN
jgi:hypothetical protein